MSDLGTFGIPDSSLPIGEFTDEKGKRSSVRLNSIWFRWVTRISQLNAEKNIEPLTVGTSPWTYTADTIGHLALQGGTISQRTLTRGSVSLNTDSNMIPVAAGDTVTVTYSVLPTAKFVPGARA